MVAMKPLVTQCKDVQSYKNVHVGLNAALHHYVAAHQPRSLEFIYTSHTDEFWRVLVVALLARDDGP